MGRSYITDPEVLLRDSRKRNFQLSGDRHSIVEGTTIYLSEDKCLYLYVVIDVTDKVRADEAALHSQKLNALGNLTGGIAHDFNNFLAVILANAELIESSNDLNEIKENYLKDIVSSSKSAAGLTRQILSFARKAPMQSTHVDPNEIAENIVGMIGNVLEPYHQLIFSANSKQTVYVDSVLLENAIVNLILNARDASEIGAKIHISVYDRDDQVIFEVCDTGVGIPDEFLEKVKEPFFSLKENDKGTGIGLAMVDQFARRSNGKFDIMSNSREGTKAIISLPGVSQKKQKKNVDAPLPFVKHTYNSKSVLIVDDNEMFLSRLGQQVRQIGHQSQTVTSLEELKKIRDFSRYDLVICDVVLKNESAIEIVDFLRKQSHFPRFIFISGNVPPDIKDRLEAMNCGRIFSKPLRFEQLKAEIERMFEKIEQ